MTRISKIRIPGKIEIGELTSKLLTGSLELQLDPDRSGHGFLILKDATGWQSATKQGVIEFGK